MLNKVILLGRVGKDVEVKTSKNGKSFCSISLATNSGFGDNKRTDWHNVVAFGKNAENCGKFLQKGALALVEGEIQYDQYEKDGKKLTSTKILAEHVTFISGTKHTEEVPSDYTAAPSDEMFDGGVDLPF